MPTVYFHVDWYGEDDKFLNEISRQSPENPNKWDDVRAVLDPADADYHVAFNQPADKLDPERLLLFCAEPPCTSFCDGWDEYDALKTFPLDRFHKPQRWWVKQDYDSLKQMEPPEKSRDLSWITSDKGRNLSPILTTIRLALLKLGYRRFEDKPLNLLERGPNDGHLLRMQFFERLAESQPDLFDLYGRGDFSGTYYHGEIEDKWEGLVDYRYSLAIENYRGPNYFSEKLTDALLAWCMPIYWGCTNLDDYLPPDSYIEIDIEDPETPEQIQDIVESDHRERNLSAIAEARRRLLDEYQVWPTVERCVNKTLDQQW